MPGPGDTQAGAKQIYLPTLGSQVPPGYKFGVFASQVPQATPLPQGWFGMTPFARTPNPAPASAAPGATNPLGAGYNNPNEPGPMANQYQRPSPFGGNAPPKPVNVRFEYAKKRLDPVLGDGWTDQFTKTHGVDPITFFAKNYPQLEGNPERQVGAALNYAENYGRFIPNAVAEWQQVHGSTPIPQSQWEIWDRYIKAGGQPSYGGDGINEYGVY